MSITKAILSAAVILFASASFANPKCSHRLASSSNDLFKDTNPKIVRVAKAKTSSSTPAVQTQTRSGIR